MTALPLSPPPSVLQQDPAARRRAAIELGVLQGVYLLFLVPWFGIVVAGAMGAGSSGSLLAVLLFFVWAGYPLVALITTVAAWVLFATGRTAPARWVNRVPLLWVVLGSGLLTWVFLAS
ncbi:hypothetical protein DQ244_00275 [Blastococcus sp. TBT05-19]|uniref:hypothetical protein n=1 Tax=Blastococcus sp. TBT05-19 TaxID=2250581 RepID=UPI000DEB0D2C|nr:hypothetical protein [Blastococcus sp. TBT05-19]RBY93858.1 hypothetical protein DQ244_00275 [Blastococcus sp. TBT05-19]